MRIHILVLDEVFDTGLSTLLDTFRIANDRKTWLARLRPVSM
jgi:hypothetical protein